MPDLYVSAKEQRSDHTDSGVIDIPDDAKELRVSLSRDGWPDAGREEMAQVLVDLSLDGGEKWIEGWMGFGAPGGELQHRGEPLVESSVTRQLPDGVGRKARVGTQRFWSIITAVKMETDPVRVREQV